MQKALRLDGFTQIDAVEEQVIPDGKFSTVVSPNPEDRCALEMGIAKAKRTGADIVLGTDLESDRVGIAVKGADGEYHFISQFKQAEMDSSRDYDFLFGYEESYGYLAGTHARDKDAVVSSLSICEMVAEAKANGKTHLDVMEEIYSTYGYYRDALDRFTLKGKDGLERILL